MFDAEDVAAGNDESKNSVYNFLPLEKLSRWNFLVGGDRRR